MLAYIPAPWILWVINSQNFSESRKLQLFNRSSYRQRRPESTWPATFGAWQNRRNFCSCWSCPKEAEELDIQKVGTLGTALERILDRLWFCYILALVIDILRCWSSCMMMLDLMCGYLVIFFWTVRRYRCTWKGPPKCYGVPGTSQALLTAILECVTWKQATNWDCNGNWIYKWESFHPSHHGNPAKKICNFFALTLKTMKDVWYSVRNTW